MALRRTLLAGMLAAAAAAAAGVTLCCCAQSGQGMESVKPCSICMVLSWKRRCCRSCCCCCCRWFSWVRGRIAAPPSSRHMLHTCSTLAYALRPNLPPLLPPPLPAASHLTGFLSRSPPVSPPPAAAEFSTRFAGQIKQQPDCDGLVLKKWEKRIDVVMKYMMVSGKKALADAGLPWDGPEMKDIDRQRCGILIGGERDWALWGGDTGIVPGGGREVKLIDWQRCSMLLGGGGARVCGGGRAGDSEKRGLWWRVGRNL